MRGGFGASLITAGGALVVATIALGVRRLVDGEWDVAEALVDAVQVVVAGVLVVAVLNWYRSLHWRNAERQAMQSLALTVHLAASGWSNPKNQSRPDLRPTTLRDRLCSYAKTKRDTAATLGEAYAAIAEDDTSPAEGTRRLRIARLLLLSYHGEGSRRRRLAYLGRLVREDLERLVAQRDDATLAQSLALLQDRVASALASADHADTVVRSKVGASAPEAWAVRAALLDPVELLAAAIDALPELRIPANELRHCVGAVRNELEWVADALDDTAGVVCYLARDLADATSHLARDFEERASGDGAEGRSRQPSPGA